VFIALDRHRSAYWLLIVDLHAWPRCSSDQSQANSIPRAFMLTS
jgi:hypothetical protein